MIKEYTSTEDLIKQVSNLLNNDLKNTAMLFDSPLKIKAGPHTEVATAIGVSTNDQGQVFFLDKHTGNWSQLKPNLIYANMILQSLLQRLRLLVSMQTALELAKETQQTLHFNQTI